MPKFAFRAYRTADNSQVEGEREATDKFELGRTLKGEGLTIILAREADVRHKLLNQWHGLWGHVGLKDKVFFASNLSNMLSAGLPLSRALSVIERQSANRKFKEIVTTLLTSVNKGSSFSTALQQFPKVFSNLFVSMVEAGEESGKLPDSLKIVADQMGKSYALRKKIRGAMIYPAVILTAMGGIGVFMMIYVVPTLAQTFAELGGQLPFTTRFIIFISSLITNHYLLLLIIVVALVTGFYFLIKTPRGQDIFARVLIKTPVISHLVTEYNSAVTARTVASLLSSGVDVVRTLNITANVLQNSLYRAAILRAAEAIPKGATLSEVLKKEEKIYPAFVGEMAAVGEETGKMPEMLLKLAVFYEDEVEAAVRDMSTIIEPVMMVIIGAGVGFFAVSIIQPIYSIGDYL